MASSTTKTTINRHQLYRVTYTILNSNSLLFLSISLLFLPLTFFASATLRFYFSDVTTTEFHPFNIILLKTIIASSQNLKTLTTSLAFTASVILSTVAGTALITSATHHAIHRQPLTFSSSFRSLSHSFLPLLHTLFAGSVTLILLFLAVTLSSIAITEAINSLGFDNFGMFFSVFVKTILSFVLAITIVYFIVIWGSAAAITVLESKSGFETLRQSANQSTEFRYASFSIVYTTGFVIGSALSYVSVSHYFGVTANWILNLQVGALCLQSSLMILLYVVANTVLYVQCKVERGRRTVPVTVEGEFSGEDVKLVVDDKDSEVFSELLGKEDANGGFVFTLFLLTVIWLLLLFVQIVFLP